MVSWDFGSRLVERLDMVCVRFGQRFGDKGDVPHYFHDSNAMMMIRKFYTKLVMHAPTWTLNIKLLWSCDTRAQDSFSLLQSTQCFQNMFFYQFVHSSESIFGHSEKLSQHLPFKCIHILFTSMLFFSQTTFYSYYFSFFFLSFSFSMRYFAT